MEKRELRLRMLDAFTVYAIAFIVTVLCWVLYGFIGVAALYIGYALAVAAVIIVSLKTKLKISAVLKFGRPGIKEIISCGFLTAGALLASLPAVLFVQIILPDFAESSFRFSQIVGNGAARYVHIVMLILISAFTECMLFDGYIFTRLRKGMRLLFVALITGALFMVFRHDLYVIVPLFMCGAAISYVRGRTSNMTLPLIMHIIINTVIMAFTDAASEDPTALFGAKLGIVQVIGMGLILLGSALPVTAVGMRIMGDFKNRPIFEKAIVLLVSVVMISTGYAISRIS